MRILLAGGGTGGHVFPLIAVAEELQKLAQKDTPGIDLLVLTDNKKWVDEFSKSAIKSRVILAGKWRRYFSVLNFLDIFKTLAGFFQSLYFLLLFMPDVVFLKGGYVSIPPLFAALWYFIPIVCHESDSVPGLANRIAGKVGKKAFLSFSQSEKFFNPAKVQLVGNPARQALMNGSRDRAAQTYNLKNAKKTILVLGGSQGAHIINQLVLNSLVELTKEFQIIHQTGEAELKDIQNQVAQIVKEGGKSYGSWVGEDYHLAPFFDIKELADVYAVCDVFVTRAGAAALFEGAALGKPMIIIPITDSAADHQMLNALEIQKFGAVILEEANLSPHIFISQIRELLKPEVAGKKSEMLKQFAKPEAASLIAKYLVQIGYTD